VRVFFALVPPPPLRQVLGDLARDVARRAHGRPVSADNVHATLAFVGAWPVSRLPELHAAGADVYGEPMPIMLDTCGAFRRAGIAWIAASQPPSALGTLAQALFERLVAIGVQLDERPFRPHVTLARHCRGPYTAGPAGPFAWDVDALALMQSDTRAEGARYRMLASWPLRASAR
jgi:2'-5' RNA ligase